MITIEVGMMHWQGLSDLSPVELHAPRTDERRPTGRAGQHQPLQDRQGAGRRYQGGPVGQVQSIGYGAGRHLASGARRLAQAMGLRPTTSPGYLERGRARHAGSRGRRGRPRNLLGAGGRAMIEAGKARSLAIMAPSATRSSRTCRPSTRSWASITRRRVAGHRGPEEPAGRHPGAAPGLPQEGLRIEGIHRLHGRPRLRGEMGRPAGLRPVHGCERQPKWERP